MNVARHVALGVALLLVLVAGSAAAEKVWTNSETNLRAEADRKSRRVARIQANRELTVIEKRGPWYRVKSGTKSGWIHRSDLRGGRNSGRNGAARAGNDADKAGSASAEPSSEPAAPAAGSDGRSGKPAGNPAAQRRNCREGSVWCDREGDAMRVVVVVSRVKAYKEPQEGEDIAFLATQDQELLVVGFHRPNWMYVQTLEGKLGWIPKDTVREAGSLGRARLDAFFNEPEPVDGGATRVTRRDEPKPQATLLAPEGPSRTRLRLGMTLGGALLGRAFEPDNDVAQARYDASSTALVTALSGELRFLLSGAWHLAVDGNFSMLAGLGGLTYEPANGNAIDVGNYVQHRTEAGLALGYDVDQWAAYARAGGLVEVFYVNDLLNDAALPRERLISPALGLRLALRPADALELGLSGDAMLLGALAQTRGREDGASDGVFAIAAQADAAYMLMQRLALHAGFRLDLVSPTWGGNSVRAVGVQGASRTDRILRLVAGVRAQF